MKAFVLACAATLGIAVVAYFGLQYAGFSTTEQGSGTAVRLD